MMKRALIALVLVGGALTLPVATAGAVSPNAGCAAILTHEFGPAGPNIDFIKTVVSPAPGRFLNTAARQEKGACALPPVFFE